MRYRVLALVMCCMFSRVVSAMEQSDHESHQESDRGLEELLEIKEDDSHNAFVSTIPSALNRLDQACQQDIKMRVEMLKSLVSSEGESATKRGHGLSAIKGEGRLPDDGIYYINILVDDLREAQSRREVAEDASSSSNRRAIIANRIALGSLVVAIMGVIAPIIISTTHCT